MWRCSKCGECNTEGPVCRRCGSSRYEDYENYMTLFALPERVRKQYAESVEKPDADGDKGPKKAEAEREKEDKYGLRESGGSAKKDRKRTARIMVGAAAGILLLAVVFSFGRNPSESGAGGKPESSATETKELDLSLGIGNGEIEEASNAEADSSEEGQSAEEEPEEEAFADNMLMINSFKDYQTATGESMLGGPVTRGEIVSVTFSDSAEAEDSAASEEDRWDVSQEQDGSVMAWCREAEGGYALYIAGEGGVTANPESRSLFAYCPNIREIHFNGNFDTSMAEDMSNLFYGCSRLISVDVEGFDTSQVTDMHGMFYDCTSLTALDVSGFDTSQVRDMRWMFHNCCCLTTLDVSGFDTSQVRDMGEMFWNCSMLTALDVTGFDTSRVTDMSRMFYGCSGLEQLDISGFDLTRTEERQDMLTGTRWE